MEEEKLLTAVFLRVALLDVLAGFRRVHLAAVGTAEVLQIPAEALQRGVDAGVRPQRGRVLVGKGFVFVEFWRWRRIRGYGIVDEFHSFGNALIFVIYQAGKEVFCE